MFEVIPNSMFEPSYGSSPFYYPTSKSESTFSWVWVLVIFVLVGWVWLLFFKAKEKDNHQNMKIFKSDKIEVNSSYSL